MNKAMCCGLMLAVSLATGSAVGAGGGSAGHTHKPHAAGHGDPTSCHLNVDITKEAERQAGGALYTGKPTAHKMKPKPSMEHMKGAHMVHKPQYGGAFFMAPNKMNHVEALYSEKCEFRVVFFNAFTKPIGVNQFRAFIMVVPDKQDEPDVHRFLTATADGTMMKTTIGEEVSRPFEIRLFVEFPGNDEPDLFTIRMPAKKS